MLNKIKLANKILLSLLISFGLFVTGISFYSDWKNGDVKKDNLLSEMGSRVLLAGKAAYNPELSGENNEPRPIRRSTEPAARKRPPASRSPLFVRKRRVN